MKKIAVLLTVYNRCEITLRGLYSLHKAIDALSGSIYEFDIYMMNDGCTDNTPSRVSSNFPLVHIIKGNGNLYWNHGMLETWKKAVQNYDYDFYLWFNDDTILTEDAICVLLQCAQNTDNSSIIVGITSGIKNKNITTYSGYKNNKARITPNGKLQLCEYFNGNIVLIPQKVYYTVGMNDPLYSHSIGDFDYGLRAKKKGIQSFVTPSFIGYCDRHNAIPTWCNPQYPLKKRWMAFKSPLGAAPLEYFIFDYRHKGIIKAVYGLIISSFKFLCPTIFYNLSRKNSMYFNR